MDDLLADGSEQQALEPAEAASADVDQLGVGSSLEHVRGLARLRHRFHLDIVFDAADDRGGFSAGAGQFDSDITDGRYPRAALGVSGETLAAVACDGRRSNVDGGLSMLELAEVIVELGADSAINLDGGGSTTLVHRGHLLNRPYSSQDQPAPASRPVVSALVFEPRGAVSAG